MEDREALRNLLCIDYDIGVKTRLVNYRLMLGCPLPNPLPQATSTKNKCFRGRGGKKGISKVFPLSH